MFRLTTRAIHTKFQIVESTVLEVLKAHEKVDHGRLTTKATLGDIGLDSLDSLDLVLDLEDKFAIRLPHAEVLKIRTVMDAISIFYKHNS